MSIQNKLVVLSLAALFSFSVVAAEQKQSAARDLKQSLSSALLLMKDVHGVGITRCDSESGKADRNATATEECVRVYASTRAAVEALETLLPSGQKINGAYVVVEQADAPVINPRISIGN